MNNLSAVIDSVGQDQLHTYQVDLDWVKQNGVLVTPHVYGTQLMTVRASLVELGLRRSDPRASRLRGLRRKLVDKHPCAHFAHHARGDTILGYSPRLPKPPAAYFAKAGRLQGLQYLTPSGWLHFPTCPYQLEDGDEGALSKWLSLAGDFRWPVVDYRGRAARWLRLLWDGAGVRSWGEQDITVDPAGCLSSLESRARASVDIDNPKGVKGYGQKLAGYGGYAWIGFKAWAAWQRDWQRYEAELDCLKAYILWRYPEFEANIRSELERIAALAWQALRRKVGEEYLADLGQDNTQPRADFMATIVEGGLARLPSPQLIAASLKLDYEVSLVQAGSDVERDRLEAERLRTEQAEAQARRRAAGEWAEAQARQARAVAGRVEAEQQAMRRAALEKARHQIEQAGSPLQQMADNLRHIVYEKLHQAQLSLAERGSLHPKTVAGLRLLVEQFDLLNSHGDDELEAHLHRLEQMMPTTGGVKDPARLDDIDRLADQITGLTRQAARRVLARDVTDDFGTAAVRW